MNEILPDHCAKEAVVLCCGNPLFGDDGFGPAVAARLNAETVPDWAAVIDTGTGVRGLLLDIAMSEHRPRLVVIVDAVDLVSARESGDVRVADVGRRDDLENSAVVAGHTVPEPGEVFEIPLDRMDEATPVETSVHTAPTSRLLRSLREAGVRVEVIVCQVASVSERMEHRLSPVVADAVVRASEWIETRFLRDAPGN